ncbi:MAG: arginase family protein [Conexibacter sp.]|jgi:arginase family enzyme|nr:arginase family protein [Conexibacter sp.]
MSELSIVGMLCRTAERIPAAEGTEALVAELAEQRDAPGRLIGSPSPVRSVAWDVDIADSRGCLLEAGGQVDDALVAGRFPVLIAADCTVSLTTLPAVVRHVPDATILWLDAHADFHSPATTVSGYLGGMCLAGACGVWDPGFGLPEVAPADVVMCGVRDIEAGENVLLETNGVVQVARPGLLADALDGRQVFVHLDLDVLDPSILPAAFPAPGGLSDGGLRTLLGEVAAACDVIGCEVTGFSAPELAELVAAIVDPVLPPG